MGIAEAAFDAGIMAGGSMGFWGAYHGSRATPANPWVGGVVGGIAGFVTGFIGGATAGASGKAIWYCLINTYGAPKPTCQILQVCNENTIHKYSSFEQIPTGCHNNLRPNYDLRSITRVPLVPNKGQTTIAASVTNDLNWLLGYL
jgi:hypothetical protein